MTPAETVQAFRQFLIDNSISPSVAVALAQSLRLEEEAKRDMAIPPVYADGLKFI